ncbi:MAG TPA: putative Ig domain-containing protein, partial [Planctomycetota bacterium]|nr:putative Ig domain-containing protein [Planctomycetota bacterium]
MFYHHLARSARRHLLVVCVLALLVCNGIASGLVGPPVITSPTTAAAVVGTAFSYQITATESPTSYGASGLPAGVTVDTTTGLIGGTPLSAGTSTVTISAANALGTGSDILILTVTDGTVVTGPPVITSAVTVSGTVGSDFFYRIQATQMPSSFSATGLPTGLALNTGNGEISGTPLIAGTSVVSLAATNLMGSGYETLTITI